MAKKIEESDVKKECPSCGLGVALDSKVCEFCGWNFDEEDEWILQIEKLERELLMEKQKFEPGSVDQRIEATLHVPTPRRTGPAVAAREEPVASEPPSTDAPTPQAAMPEETSAVSETIEVEGARIRTVRGPPEQEAPGEREPVVRQVRSAKKAPEPEPVPERPAAPSEEVKTRKVRVVRKVKK